MGSFGKSRLEKQLTEDSIFRTFYKVQGLLLVHGGCCSSKKKLFLTRTALPGVGVRLLSACWYSSWLPICFCLKKHPCTDVNQQAGEEEAHGPVAELAWVPAGWVASWQLARVLS